MPKRSVRLRLTALYAGTFLLAGTLLLTITYLLLAHSLQGGTEAENNTTSANAAGAPVAQPTGTGAPGETAVHDKLVEYCRNQRAENGIAVDKCLAGADIAAKIGASAGASAGAGAQRRRALSDLLDYSVAGLGATTVLSCLLGWVVAGRALRPVAAVTAAARRATHQRLGERLALGGPRDELTELADAFDAMLDRLDQAFAGQRRFIADASHELRTPLTAMRTAVDVTLAKPARTAGQWETMAVQVRDAVDQAERLVEALLTLARSEVPATASDPVDLATAAEDALDAARGEVRSRRLSVGTDLAAAPSQGNAILIGRAVSNLVDNAIRHNKADGDLYIRTGVSAHGKSFIEVENDGAQIPEDAVPGLFEPFQRLEERTGHGTGIGIGLSIVAAVAGAHEGTVVAHARPGGGLRIRMEI